MEWIFDGIGTLIIGAIIGVAGDRAYLSYSSRSRFSQRQRGGRGSQQNQAGRDIRG